MNPIRLIFGLDRLLARLEGSLLVLILLVALSFSFLQVILRNFFDSGITWGDVFARHLVLWIGFFGATLSTQKDSHIKIDALTKILPKRAIPIVELFINFFCIIVGFLLFLAAVKFMMDEKGAASILFKGVPTWYFILIMPVGFGIITFRYFVKLFEMLFRFAGRKIETAKKGPEVPGLDISLHIKVK